jgi:hypothetical protein
MDLDKFLLGLKSLYDEIGQKTEVLENDFARGFQEMPGLLEKLSAVLPNWFFFIEQTEIGSKEQVVQVLQDMEKAIVVEDSVLLADALLYGLQEMVGEYIRIIKGALYEE